MKRILITGATGFAGRHLVARLEAGPDGGRRRSAAPLELFGACFPEHPEKCAELCARHRSLRLLHLDLRREADVEAAVRSIRPEAVVHLAALSQVRLSWERRTETMEANLMGTYHLLEALRRHAPAARVLLVSSSDVYGGLGPLRRPYRESDRDGAVSPYAFTKIAGEILGRLYAAADRLPVVTARPFPHTGPGQSAEFVCSDWARQIAVLEAGPPGGPGRRPWIRVGDLALRRDYSDVRDVVHAYTLLLAKGRPGETYNVCSGRTTSLGAILKALIGLSTRRIGVRVERSRFRKADIPVLAGSNLKLRRETGWAARWPLERTLRDLLEGWRAALKD